MFDVGTLQIVLESSRFENRSRGAPQYILRPTVMSRSNNDVARLSKPYRVLVPLVEDVHKR